MAEVSRWLQDYTGHRLVHAELSHHTCILTDQITCGQFETCLNDINITKTFYNCTQS